MEIGNKPDENQVSSTSWSCSRRIESDGILGNMWTAFVFASSRDFAEIHWYSEEFVFIEHRYIGIECPHQSCRDKHHGRLFLSQYFHTLTVDDGMNFKVLSSTMEEAWRARIKLV